MDLLALTIPSQPTCTHNTHTHAHTHARRTYAVGLLVPRSKVKRALFWDTSEPCACQGRGAVGP